MYNDGHGMWHPLMHALFSHATRHYHFIFLKGLKKKTWKMVLLQFNYRILVPMAMVYFNFHLSSFKSFVVFFYVWSNRNLTCYISGKYEFYDVTFCLDDVEV